MSVRVEIPRRPKPPLTVTLDAPSHASPDRLLGLAVQTAFHEGLAVRDRMLAKADFSGLTLRDCAFPGCDLSEAVFAGASLKDVSFVGSILDGADFSGATMDGVDLSGVIADDMVLADVKGNGVKMLRADLFKPDLTNATMTGLDATDAQFRFPVLGGASFEESDLFRLNVADALKDCSGFRIASSEVTRLLMERCDLPALVLDRVKGSEAEFNGVAVTGGRVTDSSLDRAIFEEFSAKDVRFERLIASGASFKSTTFKDCSLSEVDFKHSMSVDILFSGGEMDVVDMASHSALRVAFIDVREMRRVGLRDANIDDLRIDGSKLVECDFARLDTEGMSLFHCDVASTDFAGASLGHATIDSSFDDEACMDEATWVAAERTSNTPGA